MSERKATTDPTPSAMHKKKKRSRRHEERISRRVRFKMNDMVFTAETQRCRGRTFQVPLADRDEARTILRLGVLSVKFVADHPPVFQNDLPLCLRGECVIMSDENERHRPLLMKPGHQFKNMLPVFRIEISRR